MFDVVAMSTLSVLSVESMIKSDDIILVKCTGLAVDVWLSAS